MSGFSPSDVSAIINMQHWIARELWYLELPVPNEDDALPALAPFGAFGYKEFWYSSRLQTAYRDLVTKLSEGKSAKTVLSSVAYYEGFFCHAGYNQPYVIGFDQYRGQGVINAQKELAHGREAYGGKFGW